MKIFHYEYSIIKTQDNSYKLIVPNTRINDHTNYFSVKIINVWNRLSDEMEILPQSKYSLIFKEYNNYVDLHIGDDGVERSCSPSSSVARDNVSIYI